MEGGKLIHCGPIDDLARSASGGRAIYRVDVRFADKARRALADFGPRLAAIEEPEPGRFDLTVDGGDETLADLVDALVLRGARVSHVAPRETALEAVYRASAAAKVA
jgi:hypothetical protein